MLGITNVTLYSITEKTGIPPCCPSYIIYIDNHVEYSYHNHISLIHISRALFTIFTWHLSHLAHRRDFSCHLSHTKYTHWAMPVTSNSVADTCGATSPVCLGSIEPTPGCCGYSRYFGLSFDVSKTRITKCDSRSFWCLWSQMIHVVEKFRHVGKMEVSGWFRRNWNILAQTYVFDVIGFSKCKSLCLYERGKCYGRDTHLIHLRG